MDYEKKYKEALQRAKHALDCDRNNLVSTDVPLIYSMFPELKESEDEGIRGAILHFISHTPTVPKGLISKEDMIGWLEKQGESYTKRDVDDAWLKGMCDAKRELEKQKDTNVFDVPKISIKDAIEVTSRMQYIEDDMKPIAEFIMDYANWDLHKDEWNQPTLTVPLFRVLDALIQRGKPYCECSQNSEKQGEQKSANEVEPKFKVGDWITNGDYTWKIVEVKPLDYILQSQDGNIVDDTISHVDEQFHSFTIQDAKNGDVLYHENKYGIEFIVMNKGINECGNIDSYFRYNSSNGFGIDIPSVLSVKCDNITPATKEQHDLLFQKMKEAGYEWDAEKKELREIEQKSAWSEEDEKRINRISDFIWKNRKGDTDEIYQQEQDVNWLKSIKQRYTWKPSDEQMEVLKEATNIVGNKYKSCLNSLYSDLKKLKD